MKCTTSHGSAGAQSLPEPTHSSSFNLQGYSDDASSPKDPLVASTMRRRSACVSLPLGGAAAAARILFLAGTSVMRIVYSPVPYACQERD